MSETWSIPAEIAKRLLSSNGMAFLIRAKARGAELLRDATVVCTADGRFVAEFHFERPIGPEKQSAVLAQLTVRREDRP